MAHIVIDARIINSSTGTYVERLLHYLQKIDTKNNYTVLMRTTDRDYWRPAAKNFVVKFADFADYSFEEQLGFKKVLDDLNADLVHFCMPQQPVLYKGKKVTTIHDLTLLKQYNSDKNYFVYKAKQLVGHFVFKKVARDSQFVIMPTKYAKNDLLEFVDVPAEKIVVTYEACDPGAHKLKKYEPPFKKYLLNVGNHSDFKNLVRLAEAHQKLLPKHPDLGLLFVCRPTPARKINEVLFRERGYKNIHFAFLSMEERDYAFTHAAVYVTPSLSEGFGLTGLEAMGFGAPVVSSNATCLPEVYVDGALYVDPLSVDDIADKIDAVLTDKKLRSDLIQRGKKRSEFFSWEKMAKETHEVYMRALR